MDRGSACAIETFFFRVPMDDIFLELADVRLFRPKFSGVNGRKICEDGKKRKKKGCRRLTRPFEWRIPFLFFWPPGGAVVSSLEL